MQTIRVTGKGILQIKPDTIRLLFSASEQEKTYDEAVKKSAAWTKKLEKLFLQLGFEKDDLKTTSMNIEGRYDWDKSLLQKRKRILVGYEYDLHMMIKFPADNERLGKIIYFLSHSKLKPSFQIEYTVDDQEKAKEDLLALEMSTNIPEVKDVIVKVRELSSDEKLRRLAFYREKRLHDEANAINGSRREGIKIGRAEGEKIGRAERDKEIIEKLLKKGYSQEQIEDMLN